MLFWLQIVHYATNLITQSAVRYKWQVMYETVVPPGSLASLKSGGLSAEACSIVLEHPANSKYEWLFPCVLEPCFLVLPLQEAGLGG